MNKETGGAAYPSGNDVALGDWRSSGHSGMTLRDYFAAKAMQTVLIGAVLPTKEDRDKFLPIVAVVAYEMADAMLEARK